MSINVYWACVEDEWPRSTEPELVSNVFFKSNKFDKSDNIQNCPSVKDFFKNLYIIKSLYSYNFFIEKNNLETKISSDFEGEDLFNKIILIRNLDKKLFSFSSKYCFFSDEDLKITITAPYMEDNFISNKTMVIPGEYNISKWYRNLDMAFYLKDGINNFSVEENDPIMYIKFNTDKKINFIQYIESKKLKKIRKSYIMSKKHSYIKRSLNDYYHIFKMKKTVLSEIKKNLVV